MIALSPLLLILVAAMPLAGPVLPLLIAVSI